MKAAIIGEHGVEVGDVAKPEPQPNEVLTKTVACGLNRADVLMAAGAFGACQVDQGLSSGWNGRAKLNPLEQT